MKHYLCIAIALACASCATYHSDQIESINTNGVRSVTTIVRAKTLFDSKSELTKLRLSTTDKTQSLTLGSLNQESSSSNLVSGIEAAARGAAAGASKPIAP